MSVFRTILGRIDDLTAKAEDTLVAYLHGAISVMVILAVILRYVFNNPLTWGEELIVALLTWIVFLGAAAAIRSQICISASMLWRLFFATQNFPG